MTYVALANASPGSSTSAVTFGSIPSTYRDLILVVDTALVDTWIQVEFNGDTTTVIPGIRALGGASVLNQVQNNAFIDAGYFSNGARGNSILQIMDYSATDRHKTVLNRWNNNGGSASYVAMSVFRYPVNTAISSIRVKPNSGNFSAGSTVALYGIAG